MVRSPNNACIDSPNRPRRGSSGSLYGWVETPLVNPRVNRVENGTSSVVHSSISIANGYVSECFVAETPLVSTSSGVPCLALSLDDIVFGVTLSLISSEAFIIPKPRTSSSSLPVHDQPYLALGQVARKATRISLSEVSNRVNLSDPCCPTRRSHLQRPQVNITQAGSRATQLDRDKRGSIPSYNRLCSLPHGSCSAGGILDAREQIST